MTALWHRYLLPGFVFQGITIGGGYATGRELIEFFAPPGPWGGLLGMLVTMLVFAAVLAASFELVRVTRSYDYRSFFRHLLGPGWVLFEVAYLLLLVVILAVIGAAAGAIAHDAFGLPPLAGTLALMAIIGVLVSHGSALVEKATAWVSLALYAAYVTLILWSLGAFGDAIGAAFAQPVGEGWAGAGLRYAGYNLAGAVGVFVCIRHATRRRHAVVAGLLAGPITMLPGVLFFVALMAFYPEIGAASVPSAHLLGRLDAPWFAVLFQLVVFAALINTGAPLLHAINERIAAAYAVRGRDMPRRLRPAVSVGLLVLSVFVASAVGLVGLIAKGYGWLTWAFIALFVVPVLTVGLWQARRLGVSPRAATAP